MPENKKYTVRVALTFHKEISVWAADEGAAEEKATDICSSWNNVEDVEVLDVEED